MFVKYKVDLVIFDFDGVIVDSADDIAIAVQHALQRLKRPMRTKDEIMPYVGHGVEMMIRRIFADCDEDMIPKAIQVYRQYYLANAVVHSKLYNQVQDTLEILKMKMAKKTAVVTSKPEELTRVILNGLEVSRYFDMVVGPESVTRMKPDPEGIHKVLAATDVLPDHAIMIGDMHSDVEAGKAAGVITCAVTYGFGDQEELKQSMPEFFINDIGQLLEYIE